jgi:hypothetical protein
MFETWLHDIVFHINHRSTQLCQCFSPHASYHPLPLCLLPRQELLQDSKILLQATEPLLQLSLDLCIVVAELLVEVLPVWCCAHGCAEDGLHNEGVVWLEGVAVGIAEGVGEFLVGVGDVVAESLGGEVETTWYVLVVYIMCEGKGMYRVSHRRPSVAVCFFSLSSLRQSSWRVSESAGAASCRSRIFCILFSYELSYT